MSQKKRRGTPELFSMAQRRSSSLVSAETPKRSLSVPPLPILSTEEPDSPASRKEPKFSWRDTFTVAGILLGVAAMTDMPLWFRLCCLGAAVVCFWVSLPAHKELPRLTRFGLPCLATLVLSFMAYQVIPKTRGDALPPKVDTEKPKLEGTIEQITFGDVTNSRDAITGKRDQYTLVILAATIRNLGAPTIATRYDLSVSLPNGTPQKGKEMIFNGPMRINGYTYSPDSGWLQKLTDQDAIPKNAQRTGFLYFEFNYGQARQFSAPGTVFSLSFRDALETVYTAKNDALSRITDRQWHPIGTPIPTSANNVLDHATSTQVQKCRPALVVGDNATLKDIAALSVGPCTAVQTGKNPSITGLQSVVTPKQNATPKRQ